MSNGAPGWKDTRLWKRLKGEPLGDELDVEHPLPESAATLAKVAETCLDKAWKVLDKAGTGPLDFTLHDSAHSFHVAEWAVDIIPAETFAEMSSYDIFHLLLACYCHDIGMTPDRGRVNGVFHYLLFRDDQDLEDAERDEFQHWLDATASGLSEPLLSKAPSEAEADSASGAVRYALSKAAELATDYCRHRHAAWGGEWLEAEFGGIEVPGYDTWLADLVDLCRSHDQGYGALTDTRFDAKLVGPTKEVLNLRYLAMTLRIADVVELDPERTPEIVFRLRDIRPTSAPFWKKDHRVTVVCDDWQLVISAEPPNARLHRAIVLTANGIERETLLCQRVSEAVDLGKVREWHQRRARYEWRLQSSVRQIINPERQRYRYIDGTFRPDVQKVLELLGGVELYGDRKAAIRELMQNAFDAVRAQLAHEMLARGLAGPDPPEALRNLHAVELRLEGTKALTCHDTGVGMTHEILEDYLLVSGRARHPDVYSLARRCAERGFRLEQTAAFGIGVLSYFMIAEAVTFVTRRSPLAGDSDATGWRFESEGVGDFGELTPEPNADPGTRVTLALRPEALVKPADEWVTDLVAYIRDVVVRPPCRLRVVGDHLATEDQLDLGAGWAWSDSNVAALALRGVTRLVGTSHEVRVRPDMSVDLVEQGPRRGMAALFEQFAPHEGSEQEALQLACDAVETLRFETFEGVLGDGLGRYRCHIPFWESAAGVSAAYMELSMDESGPLIAAPHQSARRGVAHVPTSATRMGWYGIQASGPLDADEYGRRDVGDVLEALRVLVEVDWTDPAAGRVQTNRSSVALTKAATDALDELRKFIDDARMKLLTSDEQSPLHLLNHVIASSPAAEVEPLDGDLYWPLVREPGTPGAGLAFAKLTRPFAAVSEPTDALDWRGQRVQAFAPVRAGLDPIRGTAESLTFGGAVGPPTHLCAGPSAGAVVPIWGDPSAPTDSPLAPLIAFPGAWSDVVQATIDLSGGSQTPLGRSVLTLWSAEHPVVRRVTAEALEWCDTTVAENLLSYQRPIHEYLAYNPLVAREELLSDEHRAAAWLARVMSSAFEGFILAGINERAPDFWPELWAALGLDGDERMCFVSSRGVDRSVWVLTADAGGHSHDISDPEDAREFLPAPGPDFEAFPVSSG